MSAPDYLPLTPGQRLEYDERRAEGVRRVIVEVSADGATLHRRWVGEDGTPRSSGARIERRPDGVYIGGAMALPLPPRPGASWTVAPLSFRVEDAVSVALTPAGRFADCLRVSYLIAAGDAGSGERFYAPGVGLVREDCSDEGDPFELALAARSRSGAEGGR